MSAGAGPGAKARAAVLFALATATAVAAAAAAVALVARADFLGGAAEGVARAIHAHGFLAGLAAASPVIAFLLVGYAYMMRGLRRRAAGSAAARGAPRR